MVEQTKNTVNNWKMRKYFNVLLVELLSYVCVEGDFVAIESNSTLVEPLLFILLGEVVDVVLMLMLMLM